MNRSKKILIIGLVAVSLFAVACFADQLYFDSQLPSHQGVCDMSKLSNGSYLIYGNAWSMKYLLKIPDGVYYVTIINAYQNYSTVSYSLQFKYLHLLPYAWSYSDHWIVAQTNSSAISFNC